jgi:hypothetical protein
MKETLYSEPVRAGEDADGMMYGVCDLILCV